MMRLLLGSMLVLAALGCVEDRYATMRDAYSAGGPVPPMDSSRKVSEQDCAKGVDLAKGNIRCK